MIEAGKVVSEKKKKDHAEMKQEQIARSALEAYPIIEPRIIFLRHNETMAFHIVDQQTGDGYLLRIHSPFVAVFQGERLRPEGIVSELHWLEALAEETSLTLQRPVHTKDGALVTTVVGAQGEMITCSLLRWIEAIPFPTVPLPQQVARLGTIIATLHVHAHRWLLPSTFARPVYDLAFYRQQINTLDKGVRDGIIREQDFAIIQETLEKILALLAKAQDPLILIHADLHRGNFLVSETDVYPIDFSLCGFGSPLFDLGTCLPGIPTYLRPYFLEAYQHKAMLTSGFAYLIDAFFLLSRMGAYVYLLSNPNELDWLRERIPRFTAQECLMFLEEKSLLFGEVF